MKKTKEVRIRFSLEDFEKIKSKATDLGLPVSSFIRLIVLAVKNPQIPT